MDDLELKTHLFTEEPSVVVHFSPTNILKNEIYQKFIEKFPQNCEHLLANGKNSFSGYVAAHRIQWQLNQLEQNIFPILSEAKSYDFTENCDSLRKKAKLEDPILEEKQEEKKMLEEISTLTSYHLRPMKKLDRSSEPTLSPTDYLKELDVVDGFQDILAKLKQEISTRNNRSSVYPKILFLGTGSCIPNKTRNVSSLLIRIR